MANRNFAILLGMGVILCPLAAEADSVTYNFSGTVTGASGLYSALVAGTDVTGTYNFDLANAHAGQSVSTSSSWYIQSGTADVFWATIQVGSFSESTNLSAGPGPNGANNAIFGQAPAAGEPYGWQFGGGAIVGNPDFDSIGFSILAKNGFIPFTSGGLPLFSPAQTYSATGALESQYDPSSNAYNSAVNFTISSLVQVPAVPLPASVWLMLGGLGGLGGLARLSRITSRCN